MARKQWNGGKNVGARESATSDSLPIYLAFIGVLIVGALGVWIFGVDFGFVQFGGQANINLLYGGAAISILLSYWADIKYIKAVRKFYSSDSSILDYIPYVNFIGVFGKVSSYVAWAIIGVIAVVAIPTFTPVGQYLPMAFLMGGYGTVVVVIIVGMAIFTALRGYHAFVFKREAEVAFRTNISENYGSGGNLSIASYILYFMPIIRMLPLFTDINFINSTRLELEDMARKEER